MSYKKYNLKTVIVLRFFIDQKYIFIYTFLVLLYEINNC